MEKKKSNALGAKYIRFYSELFEKDDDDRSWINLNWYDYVQGVQDRLVN